MSQRVDVDGEAKTLSLSTLEATADAIVGEQLASTEEVDAAIASLAAFTADPTTLVGDPRLFQLSSRRPAAPSAHSRSSKNQRGLLNRSATRREDAEPHAAPLPTARGEDWLDGVRDG